METGQTPTHSKTMREAYSDMLEDMKDWRNERRAENVKFYAGNIQRVTMIDGSRGRTTRKANCDVCLNPQEPGLQNFFLHGPSGHKFHACPGCWDDIAHAALTTITA
jgi:hypothetical protein